MEMKVLAASEEREKVLAASEGRGEKEKVLAASEGRGEREKVLAASEGRGEKEKVLAASEGRGEEEMNPPNEFTSREYDNSGDQVGPFFITQQHFFFYSFTFFSKDIFLPEVQRKFPLFHLFPLILAFFLINHHLLS